MVKLAIMKNKISFLAMFAIALNVNYVCASECIGDDCELETIETVDVLVPVKYEVDWSVPTQTVIETEQICTYDYNCPFDTIEECAVWYKKPMYKVSVAPRAPHINPFSADDIIQVAFANPGIDANDSIMAPLTQRYNMLMNAADACCTSGIIYKMRQNGANDKEIYEFLKDDANYFGITKRCLTMSNSDIAPKYSYGVDGQMVADVRNACLCKNRQWFDSLLQPFNDIYERVPEFKDSEFAYTYIDGLNRELSVSVNSDVQNTMEILGSCPK